MNEVSAQRYQRIIAIAGGLLTLIVLTGAAVRLTQSGLGCEDWPKCSEEAFVPEWAFHKWVEFGNRLLTGVIGFVVIAAALGAFRRIPRRPDLFPWAWGLVVGVLAQAVLGGITVRVDLHPMFVGGHYLLSIVLLWNVIVLWVKALHEPNARPTTNVPASVLFLSRAVLALATLVLIVGTLVTGTGPNGGDEKAVRLAFDLQTIARVHSATAWVLVAGIVALALQVVRLPQTSTKAGVLLGQLQRFLVITVLQGALGYLQYALGVPAPLVELHVAGSLAVWCMALWFHLSLFDRTPEQSGRDNRAADEREHLAG